MSITLDNFSSKYVAKFKAIKNNYDTLVDILNTTIRIVADRQKSDGDFILYKLNEIKATIHIDNLNKIIDEYNSYTIDIINNATSDDNYNNSVISKQNYKTALTTTNCYKSINHYFSNINVLLFIINTTYKYYDKKTQDMITDMNKNLAILKIPIPDLEIATKSDCFVLCDCSHPMKFTTDNSEAICDNCGYIKKIISVIFKDDHLYIQNGFKVKNNDFESIRHYKYWMDRIQAIENFTPNPKYIEQLHKCFERDKFNYKKYLTCDIMRTYLNQQKLSEYNSNIPSLVKYFTDKTPPILTTQEYAYVTDKFNTIIEILNEMNAKDDIKDNKPYYPYFIYKIVEYKFASSEKIKLLNYIHLQSKKTVDKNDAIYKKICEYSGGVLAIPFIKTNYIKCTQNRS